MHIHGPIAIARNLPPFAVRELAPFNGSAFCVYYGNRLDQLGWEPHPDIDELLTGTDRYRVPPGVTVASTVGDVRVSASAPAGA
jgi:hypothetical protein